MNEFIPHTREDNRSDSEAYPPFMIITNTWTCYDLKADCKHMYLNDLLRLSCNVACVKAHRKPSDFKIVNIKHDQYSRLDILYCGGNVAIVFYEKAIEVDR